MEYVWKIPAHAMRGIIDYFYKGIVCAKKVHLPGFDFLNGLTSIPAWINNHVARKVLVEIIYPFPNFNGYTVEVLELNSNFIPQLIINVITYPYWD